MLSPLAWQHLKGSGGGEGVRVGKGGRVMRLRLPCAGGEGFWYLFSMYGPVAYRKQRQGLAAERQAFYIEWGALLEGIPRNQVVVCMGDLNSRVGSLGDHEEGLRSMLGEWGVGARNEPGVALLDFCVQQGLTVASTRFCHSKDHRITWRHQHWGTGSMIDLVLVRSGDLQFVEDVRSLPGLHTDSDHMLVRAKLVQRPVKPGVRDVKPAKVEGRPKRLDFGWPDDSPVWGRLDSVAKGLDKELGDGKDIGRLMGELVDSAETVFADAARQAGVEGKRRVDVHPSQLKEWDELRKKAFGKLREGEISKAEFRREKRRVRKGIVGVVNGWWERKMVEVEQGLRTGSLRGGYEAVGTLMRFIGMQDVKKPFGGDAQRERQDLTEHFKKVFATVRSVDWEEVRGAPLYSNSVTWDPPTEGEIHRCIFRLKNHKSPGKDNVEAELVKRAEVATMPPPAEGEEGWRVPSEGPPGMVAKVLARAVRGWWEAGAAEELDVPDVWFEAIMVALYKGKGNRKEWDNWRGVWLLSVCSKVVSMVLNDRLQRVGEAMWGDEQVGFRKGRGCMDAIFTVRRAMEDIRRSRAVGGQGQGGMDDGLLSLFVDLCKAFDSVPRDVLWYLLREKVGVPERVVRLIRLFHEKLVVQVALGGGLGDGFETLSGVRQGCCKAPTLWDIYFHFVMDAWRRKCERERGVGCGG